MKILFYIFGIILMLILTPSCKEKPVPPFLSTTTATEISSNTAVSGGVISDDGGAAIISKGVCWNTSDNPTIDNSKTIEIGESFSFVSKLSQLLPATMYYARAYAINSSGTSYGNSVFFTTHGDKPTSTLLNASNIQTNSATLNGSVNPNYLSTTISFEWGTSMSYGNTTTPSKSLLSGNSSENFYANLTGLTPGTTYHFRINATNELGTSNSNDLTFTTLGQVPSIGLISATENLYSVVLNAYINPNYLSTNVLFEWGLTTSYGNTAFPSPDNLIVNTFQSVSLELSGLSSGTSYHYRITATNQLGTIVSDDKYFTTLGPISDIDGNAYDVVRIGTQVWMAKNLETTKFNDGTLIPNVSNDLAWSVLSTPAYCIYDNNLTNKATYGALYNWFTVDKVINGNKNACPIGWHVPTDVEWTTLINYLGGESIAGTKLRETGTDHWLSPNSGATNSSGFTALGGGDRYNNSDSFMGLLFFGGWWSSTEYNSSIAFSREFGFDNTVHAPVPDKAFGYSIRCLKD